jgi:GAF domain-containing protein
MGTLCVLDQRPRQFDDAQRAVLEQLAQLVVDRLLVLRDQGHSATERERLSDLARACGDWLWEADAQARYT